MLAEVNPYRIAYVSDPFDRVTGVDVASVLADPGSFLDHAHADDRDEMQTLWRRAQGEPTASDAEFRVVDRDGRVRWLHASATPILSELDVYVGRAIVLEDVTQRRELLESLTAALAGRAFTREQLLRAVWKSSGSWQAVSTVTEHVRRLRTKLEEEPARPRWLRTVRCIGYCFDAEPVPA
ncbi:MAG: winged helix-turn-helix domain-containing protein [Actinomycetota bacterium]